MNIDLTKKPFHLSPEQVQWVETTLQNLTLKEKVGQLFVINSLSGFKYDLREILRYCPGGVFLGVGTGFKRRVQRVSRFLQTHSKIPLLIAGDLELGGLGGALNGTAFSTQMGVGATNDVEMAYKFGQVIGREGSALGYNWTYSPVVDINRNWQNPIANIRSYGDDAALVLKMAKAQIRGIQECGFAATAKHWPGDGIDDRNQHYVTSHNSLDMDDWNSSFGHVYRGVIDAGVLAIMSAHIYLPDYYHRTDPNGNPQSIMPGSLSPELNIDLLRKELGFNGLLISDATGMVGMISHGTRSELVPRVISAGNDMFLFCHGRSSDFQYMLEGVETGIITKERLNEAVTRILALKAALKLLEKQITGDLVPPSTSLQIVGCTEHKQWARENAAKSITLVKDTQNLLPLSVSKHKRVLLIRSGKFGIVTWKFKRYLAKKGFEVHSYKKGRKISPDQYDVLIYLITEPPFYNRTCIKHNWSDIGGMHWYGVDLPSILISLGSPYHLYDMPRIKTLINAYFPFPITQQVVVDLLVGERKFQGQNPVDPYCGLFDAHL